jgi:hypothetical protein
MEFKNTFVHVQPTLLPHLGLLLQSVYRLFQANAGSGMDGVTIKETLHRMLGSSRISHELRNPKRLALAMVPASAGRVLTL